MGRAFGFLRRTGRRGQDTARARLGGRAVKETGGCGGGGWAGTPQQHNGVVSPEVLGETPSPTRLGESQRPAGGAWTDPVPHVAGTVTVPGEVFVPQKTRTTRSAGRLEHMDPWNIPRK